MELDVFRHADTYALQALGMVATTSMVLRVIVIVFIDDVFEIYERWRKHKLDKKELERKDSEL